MSVKKEKSEEKFFFMFNKSFNISSSISMSFLVLDNSTRFLILKNSLGTQKYIKIPNFVSVIKTKQTLTM